MRLAQLGSTHDDPGKLPQCTQQVTFTVMRQQRGIECVEVDRDIEVGSVPQQRSDSGVRVLDVVHRVVVGLPYQQVEIQRQRRVHRIAAQAVPSGIDTYFVNEVFQRDD